VQKMLLTKDPSTSQERRDLQEMIDVCHDGSNCHWYSAWFPSYCWYFIGGVGHENSYCSMFGEDYCCWESCGMCSDDDDHQIVDIPNAEHYCESGERQTNQQMCEDSGCCHWNTWEGGEASFNGEGRCWSSYGNSPVDVCSSHSEFVQHSKDDAKGLVGAYWGYHCHYDWYYGTIRCSYNNAINYWTRLTLVHIGGLNEANMYTIQCPDGSFAGVSWNDRIYCGFSDTFHEDSPAGPNSRYVFTFEKVAHEEYAIRSLFTGLFCEDDYYGMQCNSDDMSQSTYHMFDWWKSVAQEIAAQDSTNSGVCYEITNAPGLPGDPNWASECVGLYVKVYPEKAYNPDIFIHEDGNCWMFGLATEGHFRFTFGSNTDSATADPSSSIYDAGNGYFYNLQPVSCSGTRRRELKEPVASDLRFPEAGVSNTDVSRRHLTNTDEGRDQHCTIIDRSYNWCQGTFKGIRFEDGSLMHFGGFKNMCYTMHDDVKWWCGDDLHTTALTSGTGAKTLFIYYGNDECGWWDYYTGSYKCKGRVTFTALDCEHSHNHGRLLQEEEDSSEVSATDQELLAAFYDPGHGLTRENDGTQLPEEVHELHANWDGPIPLHFPRQ